MPRVTRPQATPTDTFKQLRLITTSREQETYEVLRPCVLFGQSLVARARETGVPPRTLRRTVDRFCREGMASLFAPPVLAG